jgi:nitrogen regulatory protein P-II 1
VKLVIAMIQPHRLEAVKRALNDAEIYRLTVQNVQGYGRQKGHTEYFRGQEITVNLLPKIQLTIAVEDHLVKRTVDAIIRGGRSGPDGTGKIGDGKIFVLPLEQAIRISDGQSGPDAI